MGFSMPKVRTETKSEIRDKIRKMADNLNSFSSEEYEKEVKKLLEPFVSRNIVNTKGKTTAQLRGAYVGAESAAFNDCYDNKSRNLSSFANTLSDAILDLVDRLCDEKEWSEAEGVIGCAHSFLHTYSYVHARTVAVELANIIANKGNDSLWSTCKAVCGLSFGVKVEKNPKGGILIAC